MSTRSATIITKQTERFERDESTGMWEFVGPEEAEVGRFYRHCDGYPEGHGLEMAVCFENCDNPTFRNACQTYMGAFMTGQGKGGTRLESWGVPEIEFEPAGFEHGDLEFLYKVMFDLKQQVSITVWSIEFDEHYADAMKQEPLFSGTAREYIDEFGEDML